MALSQGLSLICNFTDMRTKEVPDACPLNWVDNPSLLERWWCRQCRLWLKKTVKDVADKPERKQNRQTNQNWPNNLEPSTCSLSSSIDCVHSYQETKDRHNAVVDTGSGNTGSGFLMKHETNSTILILYSLLNTHLLLFQIILKNLERSGQLSSLVWICLPLLKRVLLSFFLLIQTPLRWQM